MLIRILVSFVLDLMQQFRVGCGLGHEHDEKAADQDTSRILAGAERRPRPHFYPATSSKIRSLASASLYSDAELREVLGAAAG